MELIKKIGKRESPDVEHPQYWGLFYCPFCKKEVESHISNGRRNRSCGCQSHATITKHGCSRSKSNHYPLYMVWAHMKQRCSNPLKDNYHHYGGRGIEVCKEWDENFTVFHEWAKRNGWFEITTEVIE